MPLVMTSRTASFEVARGSRRFTMSTPRAPPAPSSPWHPAQRAWNSRLPGPLVCACDTAAASERPATSMAVRIAAPDESAPEDTLEPPTYRGTKPRDLVLRRYTDVRAVTYSDEWSESPQARFAGCSGITIVPRWLPAGSHTQMPSGPVTNSVPSAATRM